MKNKLYSITHNKCPRCHTGKFWPSNNPYSNLFFFGGKLYEHCPHCGLPYFLEVGFYYGAMMVSYALNVLFFIVALVVSFIYVPAKWSGWAHVAVVAIPMLALVPVFFSLSRLIWINFFVTFDEESVAGNPTVSPPRLVSKT